MCFNCSKDKRSYVTMPCSVCVLNDKDSTPKSVFWCETCKAYICKKHEGLNISRVVAAVKTIFIKKP